MEEIVSNKCLHCNTKINEFNEEQFIEVVSDFTTMEKRYCCKKCFSKYYKFKDYLMKEEEKGK